jgi:hypothetical protein
VRYGRLLRLIAPAWTQRARWKLEARLSALHDAVGKAEDDLIEVKPTTMTGAVVLSR